MLDYSARTDEELIAALRDGDDKVTDYLMEKYKNMVRKKAGTMFIIGADKDDLIQEGMIGLYKAIRDYDYGRDASFSTFADLCISRQMIKAVESGNRKKHTPLNTYISLYVNSGAEGSDGAVAEDSDGIIAMLGSLSDKSPEDDFIDRENTHDLERRIYDSLSPFERQVINLHITGMGYVEIARVLGKDEKSVDNALSRIKGKVKALVKNE